MMWRIPTLLLLLPAIALAAPPGKTDTVIKGPMPRLESSTAPTAIAPAPVPNLDISAPLPPIDMHARLQPSMADRIPKQTAGEGFAPGSGYTSLMDRRARQVGSIGTNFIPSLTVKVPLH